MALGRRDVETAVEELAYAAVGFAILGFQRAQVARRQLMKCGPAGFVAERLRDLAGSGGEVEKD